MSKSTDQRCRQSCFSALALMARPSSPSRAFSFVRHYLKPRHVRGFLSSASHFSEPEIDRFVMAITAAHAMQGVHFFAPQRDGGVRCAER